MLKNLFPAFLIAISGNAIATAQYFGAQYPSSASQNQSSRVTRIARATEGDAQKSPSDELDALEELAAPTTPPQRQSPESLNVLDSLEPPSSLDIPGGSELLGPPANLPTTRSVLEHTLAPAAALPDPIDFNQAIAQQQYDLSHSHLHDRTAQYFGGTGPTGITSSTHSSAGCQCGGHAAHITGHCESSMPYRVPVLPPPNSFHGYFRSNPCHFDVWANYPAEAAAACAHRRAQLTPRAPKCRTCLLANPCNCP
jgi:hypothetical protein